MKQIIERRPRLEYICRCLTPGNKTGAAYGLTIPRQYVKDYNLLGKKFNIKIGKKFMTMKVQIVYTEESDSTKLKEVKNGRRI